MGGLLSTFVPRLVPVRKYFLQSIPDDFKGVVSSLLALVGSKAVVVLVVKAEPVITETVVRESDSGIKGSRVIPAVSDLNGRDTVAIVEDGLCGMLRFSNSVTCIEGERLTF